MSFISAASTASAHTSTILPVMKNDNLVARGDGAVWQSIHMMTTESFQHLHTYQLLSCYRG